MTRGIGIATLVAFVVLICGSLAEPVQKPRHLLLISTQIHRYRPYYDAFVIQGFSTENPGELCRQAKEVLTASGPNGFFLTNCITNIAEFQP